mgnify:CR=1 FL=1
MRVVHERDGDRHTLATNVELADTSLKQMRGLMFRRSIPDDYALVFEKDAPGFPLSLVTTTRAKMDAHMLFVGMPIDVVWIDDGTVTQVATLSPWTGSGIARADTMIELPAGTADAVEPGDQIRIDGAVDS